MFVFRFNTLRQICPRIVAVLSMCALAIGTTKAQVQTAPVVVTQADRTKEYNVKSVYLYNFARYIEWPAQWDERQNTDRSFRIGIFGTSGIQTPLTRLSELRSVTSKRTGENLPLQIEVYQHVNDCQPCQILFVTAETSPENVAQLIEKFRGLPVMLVGEQAGFAANGGTSEFLLHGNGIRFNLNLADVQQKGLKPDAKLLKAAHEILQPGSTANLR